MNVLVRTSTIDFYVTNWPTISFIAVMKFVSRTAVMKLARTNKIHLLVRSNVCTLHVVQIRLIYCHLAPSLVSTTIMTTRKLKK
jgi:hypothetical protein